MKRRQFTISVATLAGLSTLFGPSAFAALDLLPKNRNADLSMARECFEARLGQQFTVRGGVVETKLRLNDVKSAIRGHDREQFHVLFEAPEGQLMPEGLKSNPGERTIPKHPGKTSHKTSHNTKSPAAKSKAKLNIRDDHNFDGASKNPRMKPK